MSISSETRKAGPYDGNDVTDDFPFAFKVFADSDLLVVLADSNGAETELVLTTDYTVALNADQEVSPGGTVTALTPPATGYTLTISSQVENLQPVTLTNNGGFFPAVINTALDRLTILVQQLAEKVSRSLKLAISTPAGFNSTLPAPVPYQLIGWNATGDGFQNTDPTYSTALATDLAAGGGSALVGFLQAGTGSALRTVNAKLLEGEVSAKDKTGADPTGAVASTTALQNALDIATELFIPAGTWKAGALTVPANVRRIRGAGVGKTIFNADGVISGAGLFNLDALSNVELHDFTINMPAASFPDGWGISLNNCSGVHIHHVAIPQAPAAGIRGDGCSGIEVDHCDVIGWTVIGIHLTNSGQRNRVHSNYVPGSGTQSSHNIQVSGGGTHEIIRNFTSENTTGFGANFYGVNGGVMQGNVHAGRQIEGYNVQNSSNVSVAGNVVVYSGATSSDFGISVYGEDAPNTCYNVKVSDNIIVGSGKAGVALAQYCDGCSVTGNQIRNPNRLNEAQWGGVTAYGLGCNGNYIGENFVYSTDAQTKYAANEYNDGTGAPNFNIIKDNAFTGSGLTAEVALTGANSLAYMMKHAAFAPTISPATGAITSYTVNSAKFKRRGEFAEMTMDITITNAGTGAGSLTVLFGAGVPNAAANAGTLTGRESGVSGKMCGGVCNSGGLLVLHADGTTVIATNARVVISGIYRTA